MDGKTVPWESIEAYIKSLEDHQKQVTKQVNLKGKLNSTVIENSLTVEMYQMYELLTSILTNHGIIKVLEDESKDKIELILKTALSLQNNLIILGSPNIDTKTDIKLSLA